MQTFFLIHGYGVAQDIFKDDNYRNYLNTAFNTIYDACVRDGVQPVIIFSGGRTDMFKPYRRTEAGEMVKYFKELARRPFVSRVTSSWKYELEAKAMSSLENLLLARELLKRKYPRIKHGTIIFEATRTQKIQTTAKKIFPKLQSLVFLPIDFDISAQRYDLELIGKKETYALKVDLWALESPKNLKVHHDLFADKMKLLRQAGPKHHQEAIQAWWRQSLERAQAAGLT